MYNFVKSEEVKILKELEQLIGKPIPRVKHKIGDETFGVQVEDGKIIELGLYNCGLTAFPEDLGILISLQTLIARENQLVFLPASFGELTLLRTINLNRNSLESLPEAFYNLKSLQTVQMMKNNLTKLSESLGDLKALEILDLRFNKLTVLPEAIGNLKSLTSLSLDANKLGELPESIGQLNNLKQLTLSGNRLRNLPDSICNLVLLEELDLNQNYLKKLPDYIWRLGKLKIKLARNNWEGYLEKQVKENIGSKGLITNITHFWKIYREHTSVHLFISHDTDDYEEYRIAKIAEFLEGQPEIYQTYYCERDIQKVGHIDKFIEIIQTCHILIFLATQKSIKSKDCRQEVDLALSRDIKIIPIRGKDVDWSDLRSLRINREVGLEFCSYEFHEFLEALHKNIIQYKRRNVEKIFKD